MNRILNYRTLALLLILPLLFGSCKKKSDIKPLSQLKKEQRRAIDRLISTEGFRVINRDNELLPEEIDKSVFYRLSNGLYMRVLDAGDQKAKAVAEKTRVLVQMKGRVFNESKGVRYTFNSLNNPSYGELKFLYVSYYNVGAEHYRAISSGGFSDSLDQLLCEGVAFPASLLGSGARVQLIIPFELGPTASYTEGNSIFVEEARYIYQ
mgnify:FL=1